MNMLKVDKETSVTINMILLIGAIVSAFTVGGTFWSFRQRFIQMEKAFTEERWTLSMQYYLWEEFADDNPEIVPPDVLNIHRKISGQIVKRDKVTFNDNEDPKTGS